MGWVKRCGTRTPSTRLASLKIEMRNGRVTVEASSLS
jgi:hypothetical protein